MIRLLISFAADFAAPLTAALDNRRDMELLLAQLGLDVFLDDGVQADVAALLDVTAQVQALVAIAVELSAEEEVTGDDLAPLTLAAADLLIALKGLADAPPADLAALPGDLADPALWEAALKRLPEVMLMEWLAVYQPKIWAPFALLGIARAEPLPRPHGAVTRSLDWARLGQLFEDPAGLVAEVYGWGGAAFDVTLLLRNLGTVLAAYGIEPVLTALPEPQRSQLQPDAAGTPYQLLLPVPPLPAPADGVMLQADLSLTGRQAPGEAGVSGLALAATATGEAALDVPLSGSAGLTLSLSLAGTLDGAAGVAIHPGGPQLFGAAPALTARAGLSRDGEPLLLFGKAGGSRLELAKFGAEASLTTSPPAASATIDIGGAARDGLRAVITAADGDGFLRDLLGETAFEVTSGISLTADSATGIRFDGGAGFDIELPLGLEAGPFRLDALRLAMSAGAEGLTALVAITGGADLSVIAFTVDGIGLTARLHPTAEGEDGLFGDLDLTIGFKPPTGLGLAIDAAGVISGGGYLSIEPDIGRYAGIGNIRFVKFELTAVALIETRMPDGSEGWSLYISVTVIFPGGLPIFPSFSLNGIGGMIGLNRTVDTEALLDRLADGALDSLLFPVDPIANAPQIIEDVAAVFPAAEGQFLFGALVQFRWGVFALGNLGVVVELPSPFRLITLGQMKLALPMIDAPEGVPVFVQINLDVVGIFDFTEALVEVTAILRDSFIGPDPALVPDAPRIELSGGMAFKATFSGRPSMLLSIGGFHPDYQPPEGFRTPNRIRAALPVGDAAELSLSGYFAIGPGALMAGGRVDLIADLKGFTARGWMGFDAIIYLDPFGFDFRTEFGSSISKGNTVLLSVDVSARVTGPHPIEVWADATFEILGFEKTIDLHLTTGSGQAEPPAAVDAAARLRTALEDPEALKPAALTGAALPVVLAEGATGVDPGAALEITQSVLPLGETLEIFQGAPILGPRRFALTALRLDGTALPAGDWPTTVGWFPYNEYHDLTEDEKLARPAFEEMVAGATLGGGGTQLSAASAERPEAYDETIIDRAFGAKSAARVTRAPAPMAARRATRADLAPRAVTVGALVAG
ncbi:DUF6603 domain-containing protein [Pseudoroseicyclus sp. CXY001]|uniref:DUF6603 domain-containing protein n=1 Tax=Pseudoroseicyclus sp. CXY001 TaxID=3242492 RepID=UPI00358DCFE2